MKNKIQSKISNIKKVNHSFVPKINSFNLGDFKNTKIINSSSFGTVCKAKPIHNQFLSKKIKREEYAIKILSNNDKENQKADFLDQPKLREIEIMNAIDNFPHENLLDLLDFSIDSKNHQISLLMDYIPNNLYDFIKKNSITEEMLKSISLQIIAGVNHLHNLGYLHRDLKSRNILVDKNKDGKILVKIIDYGLGVNISQNRKDLEYCGTSGYEAPEMLLGSSVYYKSLDVWSIGVVILEILFKRENIFYGNPVKSLMKIMKYFGIDQLKDIIPYADVFPNFEDYNKEIEIRKNTTKNIFQNENLEDIIRKKQTIIKEENIDLFINFIKKLLVLDPTKRAKLKELQSDPWINSN